MEQFQIFPETSPQSSQAGVFTLIVSLILWAGLLLFLGSETGVALAYIGTWIFTFVVIVPAQLTAEATGLSFETILSLAGVIYLAIIAVTAYAGVESLFKREFDHATTYMVVLIWISGPPLACLVGIWSLTEHF